VGGGGALGFTNWRVGGSSSIGRGGRDDAILGMGAGGIGAGGRALNVIPFRGRSVVISSSDIDRSKTRGRSDGEGRFERSEVGNAAGRSLGLLAWLRTTSISPV
jgi:hypothetical protein